MILRRGSRGALLCAVLSTALGACGDLPPQAEGATSRTSSPSALAAPSSASSLAPASSVSAASTPAASTSASAASAPGPVIAAAPSPAASALASDPPKPLDGKGAGLSGPVDVTLDGEWILRLATAPIVEVTPNRGGSSVSMRVRFADGKKAAIKPEQTGRPTDPRAEIAAYHVDRLLGFGRTAAVAGRALPAAELRAGLVASGADAAFLERFDRFVTVRDGRVDAALVAWHTAALVEEEAEPAWASILATADPIPDADAVKLGERSDLVVFDFLVDNPDRYSGGNILRLGNGGPLVFLDQGAAFGKKRLEQGLTTRDRLEKVCRFRGATLAALRRVGAGAKTGERLGAVLAKSLGRDALAPVLDAAQIAGIDERAAAVEAHVRGCSAKVGRAGTLPR